VNGQKNTAFLTVENAEEEAVKVHFIGGALWSLGPDSASVRNLSMVRAGPITIRPGETHRLEYGINTELHPQDLRLLLAAVVEHPAGQFSEITAYNGTVSIVEAPISIFDPQMYAARSATRKRNTNSRSRIFLYLFLGALFGGTCWFIYRTWVRQLFPHGKKPAAKTSKAKKADAPKPAAADAADAAAAASGAKPYDESWIPPQHLQRPEAKRVRSGTPKTKSK